MQALVFMDKTFLGKAVCSRVDKSAEPMSPSQVIFWWHKKAKAGVAHLPFTVVHCVKERVCVTIRQSLILAALQQPQVPMSFPNIRRHESCLP